MKTSHHQSEPLSIPEEIQAKCTGPDQFDRFDRLFRSVITVPKASIDKREKDWKKAKARKKKHD